MIKNLHTKLYGVMGKVFCAGAGVIVGFVMGGLGFAAVGLVAGLALGFFLEKTLVGEL
jgi:hypothetical protein